MDKEGKTAPVHAAGFKGWQTAMKTDDIFVLKLFDGLGTQKGYPLFGSPLAGVDAFPDGVGMGKV